MRQVTLSASRQALGTARDYYSLCKPRVTALIVFTALAGMLVASTEPLSAITLISALVGITLISGSAAAMNALIEIRSDSLMDRTKKRPLPSGRLTVGQASVFTATVALLGLLVLFIGVNSLTMWLALASFFGYAIIYTLFLKPYTSQNIVIGGAAGAMPPVLGWSAATNALGLEPLLLFLIIFIWTPPHFWSLAMYYRKDYEKGGFPMLPVTHGEAHTRLNILVYTGVLFIVSVLPFTTGFANGFYLFAAIALGIEFLRNAYKLFKKYTDAQALATFKYSIMYLFLLFSALIVDHYIPIWIKFLK